MQDFVAAYGVTSHPEAGEMRDEAVHLTMTLDHQHKYVITTDAQGGTAPEPDSCRVWILRDHDAPQWELIFEATAWDAVCQCLRAIADHFAQDPAQQDPYT